MVARIRNRLEDYQGASTTTTKHQHFQLAPSISTKHQHQAPPPPSTSTTYTSLPPSTKHNLGEVTFSTGAPDISALANLQRINFSRKNVA